MGSTGTLRRYPSVTRSCRLWGALPLSIVYSSITVRIVNKLFFSTDSLERMIDFW